MKRNSTNYQKILQEILMSAIKLTAYDNYVQNYAMSAEAWDKIEKDYPNIQIKTFPKEVMDKMKAVNESLIIKKVNDEFRKK